MDIWRLLIGRPLKASEAKREEIRTPEGLAALSLDALTSVAYGPQAIIVVLATAGTVALHLLLPITVAIIALLVVLVLSYTQVIEAYPGGGGAYTVSQKNLGAAASQLAAAALIVDYVLTVAVSVAAGVAALTSAFPGLLPWTVPLCLLTLGTITVLNLRGVGESARAFLLPTFVFIVGVLSIVAIGLIHPHAAPTPAVPTAANHLVAAVGLLLVLKAFAAGCSALTGVEAIANGVPLFAEPRVARAKRTEFLLGGILAAMLLGVAVLAVRFGVRPEAGQTVLSQVMALAVGRSWTYYTVALATTATLLLAANTSFGALPVLASLLARDNYLPHVFAVRGDRLVFQTGVWALFVFAGILLVASRGNTDALIPLFAIGVFTGFTLSQTGMVLHWLRTRPPHWALRAALNTVGACVSGLATLVFLYTKFTEGAWVVVVAVPLLILLFHRVSAYYRRLVSVIRVTTPPRPRPHRTLVIVPVRGLSKVTVAALSDALSLGDEVVAVHVQFEGDPPSPLPEQWGQWDPGVRLVTLNSQFHSVVRPLLRFIRSMENRNDERVVVLIPDVTPAHWWQQPLHNQTPLMLAAGLRARAHVIVSLMPYRPDEEAEASPAVTYLPRPEAGGG